MHGHLTAAAPALAGAGLWAAFLLGLTGGFGHCLAMCGPLVAATSLAEGEGRVTAGGDGPGRPLPSRRGGAAGLPPERLGRLGRLLALWEGVAERLGHGAGIEAARPQP